MALSGAATPLGIPNFGPNDRPALDLTPGLLDITAAIDTLLGARSLIKLWDSIEAGVVFPTASFTTPSLAQAGKHLLVEMVLVCDQAGALNAGFQINGDTGSTYTYQVLEGQSATVAASTAVLSYARLGFAEAAATSLPAPCSARILHYAEATKHKGIVALSGSDSSGLVRVAFTRWKPAADAAVSTLTFVLNSAGNFVAPTRVTVYREA